MRLGLILAVLDTAGVLAADTIPIPDAVLDIAGVEDAVRLGLILAVLDTTGVLDAVMTA